MRLEIIVGPMFSGKSSELIRRCSRYEAVGKNVCIINHSIDTRCGPDAVATHSNIQHNAIKCAALCDVENSELGDVVGIDEAQFFGDLFDFVQRLDRTNTVLLIAGLDGDYMRRPFGQLFQCIPFCDSITKLNAMCSVCRDGTPGIFTKRTSNGGDTISVGASDKYISVCSKHYHAA